MDYEYTLIAFVYKSRYRRVDPKSLVGLVSGMRVTEIHYFSERRKLHSPNPPFFQRYFGEKSDYCIS